MEPTVGVIRFEFKEKYLHAEVEFMIETTTIDLVVFQEFIKVDIILLEPSDSIEENKAKAIERAYERLNVLISNRK